MTQTSEQKNLYLSEHYNSATVSWIDDMTLQCQGVQLRLTRGLQKKPSSQDIVSLFKAPRFIKGYLECLQGLQVDNMVEVGIRDGGSAIFFWNLLQPKRLCCIELNPEAPELSHYIDRQALQDKLHTHFNIDQADRQRVSQLTGRAFAGQELDLVIDDASHLYGPSLATFEVLFPRLRAGGLYILEDWKAGLLISHRDGALANEETPLHQLVHELLELSLYKPKTIPSIRCYHHFVVIERGSDELEEGAFAVAGQTG